MLELARGAMRMLVLPETGGAVARLSWNGRQLLRPVADADLAAGNARRLGMFPLAPYSNRIAGGNLVVDQRAWPLRHNCAGEPHSMHGFAWQRPWNVAQCDAASATLVLHHEPDADWPFRCSVAQHFALDEDGLNVHLLLENEGDTAMPGGLGFHPYFVRTAQTRLQVDWEGRWEMDERKLPTRWQALSASENFRAARPIGGWSTDHCYTGWAGEALLDYGTHTVAVSSAGCTRLVCFVPDDGRMLVALEPVSHVNNAFALARQGVPDTGMRLLQPGESMTLGMSVRVRPKP